MSKPNDPAETELGKQALLLIKASGGMKTNDIVQNLQRSNTRVQMLLNRLKAAGWIVTTIDQRPKLWMPSDRLKNSEMF
jgi:predicted transcriptional regulator